VRLGNPQVANIFTDEPWKFRRNWLRRKNRNLASLAWCLTNNRQLAELGGTTILHQLGHPEKRKRPEQFDTHEVYNSKVGALTHQINEKVAPIAVIYYIMTSSQRENAGKGETGRPFRISSAFSAGTRAAA